jgi:hypothetical protein
MAAEQETFWVRYEAVGHGRWREGTRSERLNKTIVFCDCPHGHGSPKAARECPTAVRNRERFEDAAGEGDRALKNFLRTYEVERVEDG